ncbi:hypothetical protein C8R47DRAFT_1078500 [Mycena vitilis]|nr:hypothetical protein C8R47DRAFT_1078500 [Mycena vitilis]
MEQEARRKALEMGCCNERVFLWPQELEGIIERKSSDIRTQKPPVVFGGGDTELGQQAEAIMAKIVDVARNSGAAVAKSDRSLPLLFPRTSNLGPKRRLTQIPNRGAQILSCLFRPPHPALKVTLDICAPNQTVKEEERGGQQGIRMQEGSVRVRGYDAKMTHGNGGTNEFRGSFSNPRTQIDSREGDGGDIEASMRLRDGWAEGEEHAASALRESPRMQWTRDIQRYHCQRSVHKLGRQEQRNSVDGLQVQYSRQVARRS